MRRAWIGVILLALSGCPANHSPPVTVAPPPTTLLGCDGPGPKPADCPAPAGGCSNTAVAGVAVVPWSCPGTGLDGISAPDIAELHQSFGITLEYISQVESATGKITTDQEGFQTTVKEFKMGTSTRKAAPVVQTSPTPGPSAPAPAAPRGRQGR